MHKLFAADVPPPTTVQPSMETNIRYAILRLIGAISVVLIKNMTK